MRVLPMLSLCVALLAGVAGGCGKDEDGQRRALLKPVDRRQKWQKEREKRQLFDQAGELLPSGEIVAGINLPKGLKLHRSFESEWYYEAPYVPLAALDRYFVEHLDPLGIERGKAWVMFQNALPEGVPTARRVTVRVAQLSGGNVCDVYINQAAPLRTYPSRAEAEALLQARRKRAD